MMTSRTICSTRLRSSTRARVLVCMGTSCGKGFSGGAGHDALFVGGHDLDANFGAVLADPGFRPGFCVASGIEGDAELFQIRADSITERRGVFPDAAGEGEDIEAAERDQETAYVSADVVHVG